MSARVITYNKKRLSLPLNLNLCEHTTQQTYQHTSSLLHSQVEMCYKTMHLLTPPCLSWLTHQKAQKCFDLLSVFHI